jgi:hypothetical protein
MVDVMATAAESAKDANGADPMALRRKQIKRWVSLGKRVGYLCLLLAIAAVVVGIAADFPAWTQPAIVIGLVGPWFTLLPATVFAYGLRAAEREERKAAHAKAQLQDSKDAPA